MTDSLRAQLALALALAGFTCFALLYGTQPILPQLTGEFGVSPATASLTVAAMAYLGDEIPPEKRARAMGLYIAANALGGMSGRFIVAGVTEWLDWRYGLASLGVIGTAAAIVFWRMLPPARHFTPRSMQPRALAADLRAIARDPGLPKLFGIGFLVLGIFVGAYNYLGYRLSQPPYGLGPGAIGAIFALYAIGSASSALTGYAMGRLGRSRILLGAALAMGAGLLVTLTAPLAVVIAGLAIFTIGFFAVHTVASAWVGRRGGSRRGLASALYLSGYYCGASVIGSAAGWPWSTAGWPGVVTILLACTAVLVAISLALRRLAED
jgi:YNFM family putative membrane transporter